MGYGLINEDILTDTASRIRAKAGLSDTITPAEFADKIQHIDPKRMNTAMDGLEVGRWGMRAAETAESYVQGRFLDGYYWCYNANGGPLDFYDEKAYQNELAHLEEADAQDDDDPGESDTEDAYPWDGKFTDYNPMSVRNVYRLYSYATKPYGKAARRVIGASIDCSTFVSLALRGIDFDHSPWKLYGDIDKRQFTWNPARIVDMGTNEGWEQKIIDYQPDGMYCNIGVDGYSSLRTAADLADFYYRNGLVLYDRPIYTVDERAENQPLATEILPLLKPGDLLFFSGKYTDDDGVDHLSIRNRFRCVSHIAIVARNATKCVEVTNGKTTFPNGVYYRDLTDIKLRGLTLAIRPDYRPRQTNIKTPVGTNQLTYPWTYSRRKSYTYNGVTLESLGGNEIALTGTSTAVVQLTLAGSTSDDSAGLWLSAGTYEVGGMDATGQNTTNFAIQVKPTANTDFSPRCRGYYNSTENTFTLTEPTRVFVRLYIGAGRETNCTIAPTIVRTA